MNSKITTGHLDIVELPFLNAKRAVRIWTPDDYSNDKKYPVIYMHDGQNIFNFFDKSMEMWNLNEMVSDCIIVGVDHGGVKRIDELSPKAWTKYGKNAPYICKPCGEEYCDFLVNTVMKFVNENYSTKQGREFTSIGGSSMGGIMSLYIALTYKEIFGKAYVFSPAFKVYSTGFFEKYLQENPIILENLPYLYIASGGTHGAERKGSGGDESIIAKYVPYIKEELIKRGYPKEKIETKILEGRVHHETTWRELFPSAYKWLENK